MTNMKSIIDAYDWLLEQAGEIPKKHADALENLIFEDLLYREKLLQLDLLDQRGVKIKLMGQLPRI